jgi:hypothetical protein
MNMPSELERRPSEIEASRRLGRRLKRRLVFGFAIGSALGIGMGLLAGAAFFRFGAAGFWIVFVGCTIFMTAIVVLVAGYSSLESPDPGREPSQVENPIADRPELSRTEHEPRSQAATPDIDRSAAER